MDKLFIFKSGIYKMLVYAFRTDAVAFRFKIQLFFFLLRETIEPINVDNHYYICMSLTTRIPTHSHPKASPLTMLQYLTFMDLHLSLRQYKLF